MTWIDDRLEERRKLEHRQQTLQAFGFEAFSDLWSKVAADIAEARQKGIQVSTDGGPNERIVRLAAKIEPGEDYATPKELTLSLGDDLRIKIRGATISSLELGTTPEDVVCLIHNGKEISAEDAARLILDPFLFPELDKY